MSSVPSPPPKRLAAKGLVALAIAAGVIGLVVVSRHPAEPAPVSGPSSAPDSSAPPSIPPEGAARAPAITPEITTAEDDDVVLDVFSLRVAETRFDVVDLGMGRDLAGALAQRSAS